MADWTRLEVNGVQHCLDSETGARYVSPYQGKSDATKVCKTLGPFLAWLDNAAEAAAVRFTLVVNPDGTYDTKYPAGDKAPSVTALSWSSSCLTTALAPIASQFTGTATSINVRTCLSGTNSASAVITENGGADWSISSDGAGNNLVDAGSNAGSGSIALTATYLADATTSSSFPWSYQAPVVSDTTAPNYVTGVDCDGSGTLQITCTFDSTVDPDDSLEDSGLASYRIYRDGVEETGDSLTATSPGMVDDFTAAAIGTASGTANQSGASWTLSGNGGAGIEGTADNINQISMPINGSSHTIIARISTIQLATTTNKALLEFRESLNANSIAFDCSIMNVNGALYTSSRNRATTGGSRSSSGQLATLVSPTMPSLVYAKAWYDSSGYNCAYSLDGGVWVNFVTNFQTVVLPSAKYASIGCTATQAATSINCVYDYVSVNNVGTLSKTFSVADANAATYTVRPRDVAGNTQTALAGSIATPGTPPPNPGGEGIRTQSGYYAIFDTIMRREKASNHLNIVLSQIQTEICNQPYIHGILLRGTHSFFEQGPLPGNYTGSASAGGFTYIDAVLNALAACDTPTSTKMLLLSVKANWEGPVGDWTFYFPAYMVPTSQGGTDAVGKYKIVSSPPNITVGLVATIDDIDNYNVYLALAQAYCARYADNPHFYYFDPQFDTSYAVTSADIDEAAAGNNHRALIAATRTACPHVNIPVALTFTHGDNPPSQTHQMSEFLEQADAIDSVVTTSDVFIDVDNWGQQAFKGLVGEPVTDWRGTLRYFAEIEPFNMCSGIEGSNTPQQLFDGIRFGNGAGIRPLWSSQFVIQMSASCNAAGTGWIAWKDFINNTIQGQVMDNRSSTLRTQAEADAIACESSLTCLTYH